MSNYFPRFLMNIISQNKIHQAPHQRHWNLLAIGLLDLTLTSILGDPKNSVWVFCRKTQAEKREEDSDHQELHLEEVMVKADVPL